MFTFIYQCLKTFAELLSNVQKHKEMFLKSCDKKKNIDFIFKIYIFFTHSLAKKIS